MDLRLPRRLESRLTEEFLPIQATPKQEQVHRADHEGVEVKTSTLPYHIARHRKIADSSFRHARGKEHGLKHLDIRKGVLALFWILVFMAVVGILFAMITDLVSSYVSMPVATQIKSEQETMLFPDVSICAKVPFYEDTGPGANQTDLNLLLNETRNAIIEKMIDASIKLTEDGIHGSLLIQMATNQDGNLLRAFQHIIYCQYDDRPCSFYNFTEIAHLRYVQCFTFSPNKRWLSGGKGLQFMFYKRHADQRPFLMLNDLEDVLFTDPINDGIHVLVHNPSTFPTYSISNIPTSFSVRFGQQATVEISGLQYQSDKSGRKPCLLKTNPFKYTNFRGGANFLEYVYTYEDCIANMKQRHIYTKCKCFSDNLFVPFKGADAMKEPDPDPNLFSTEFCRDIRRKTSQRLREEFLCYDQYEQLPRTVVLDQFIPMDVLYQTRNDLDARKIERHKVCSLMCVKMIYSTRFFEVIDINENLSFTPNLLNTYMNQLSTSQLDHPYLRNMWTEARNKQSNDTEGEYYMDDLRKEDIVIVDLRINSELADVWQEELTESLFNFISNLGGTLGLCAGISFLSSFFLVIFFGRAFYHALVSLVLWFWWSVYLGKPAPTPIGETETTNITRSKAPSSSHSTGDESTMQLTTMTSSGGTPQFEAKIRDVDNVQSTKEASLTSTSATTQKPSKRAHFSSIWPTEPPTTASVKETSTEENSQLRFSGVWVPPRLKASVTIEQDTPGSIMVRTKDQDSLGDKAAKSEQRNASEKDEKELSQIPPTLTVERDVVEGSMATSKDHDAMEDDDMRPERYHSGDKITDSVRTLKPSPQETKPTENTQSTEKKPEYESKLWERAREVERRDATRSTAPSSRENGSPKELENEKKDSLVPMAEKLEDFEQYTYESIDNWPPGETSSEEFPSFIYEVPTPNPPRTRERPRQNLYVLPESEEFLPPLTAQGLIPEILRSRYGQSTPPPPYSSRRRYG